MESYASQGVLYHNTDEVEALHLDETDLDEFTHFVTIDIDDAVDIRCLRFHAGDTGGDDERDEVVITIKESTFDKMSGLCHMVADIEVSRVTTFRDIALDSRVLQTKLADGTTRVDVDIFYSNSFLKKAYGTFFVKPLSDTRCEMRIQIHVRFGWFFNLFITQKRFRNIVEWRMQEFMRNLRTEAEKRYTQQLFEGYFIQ